MPRKIHQNHLQRVSVFPRAPLGWAAYQVKFNSGVKKYNFFGQHGPCKQNNYFICCLIKEMICLSTEDKNPTAPELL